MTDGVTEGPAMLGPSRGRRRRVMEGVVMWGDGDDSDNGGGGIGSRW